MSFSFSLFTFPPSITLAVFVGVIPAVVIGWRTDTILRQAGADYVALKQGPLPTQSLPILAQFKMNSNADGNINTAGKMEQTPSNTDAGTIRVRDQTDRDIFWTGHFLQSFPDADTPAVELTGIMVNVRAHFNQDILYR